MARIELTKSEEAAVRSAHRTVAEAEQIDMSDDLEMARTLGALQATVKSLLLILDEDES